MTGIRTFAALVLLALSSVANAAGRQTTSLDGYWRFAREDIAEARQPEFDDAKWFEVTLPHTFNGGDGEDGGGYYRGPSWYRHSLVLDRDLTGRKTWLQFDGAALAADVYVNGTLAGKHEGGYARFRIDVTPFVRPGKNLVAVRVDSTRQLHIAPLGGDFTVFGGLYRHVSLVTTANVQLDMLDHGSPGVFVSTASLTDQVANIAVRARVSNARKRAVRVTVASVIYNAQGGEVARVNSAVKVAPGEVTPVAMQTQIKNPKLWRGVRDPYLYRVVTSVRERLNEAALDEVTVALGVRTVAIDAAHGFLLNGEPYPLHGVNLFHSGRPAHGLAVTDEEIRRDFETLKELGVTGVRFVHFQHPPLAYEEADRLGFVVWTEIPLNGAIDPGEAFARNLEQQALELIRQNYNHPSVSIWGLGNEVYAVNPDVNRVLAGVQLVMKREDPSRPTTYAHCCQADDNEKASHSDTIAFNRYLGWYPEQKGSLGEWAKAFHAKYPERAFSIGEYGAGASIRHQEASPSQPETTGGWHPEQFQALFHEKAWSEIAGLDFVWGKFIWVAFDLASDGRAEGDQPGINDKGIVTYDRAVRKDAFFYYQAHWSQTPMLHLTSKRLTTQRSKTVEVKAYTNAATASLKVNGILVGSAVATDRIVRWENVVLASGVNDIEVSVDGAGTSLRDTARWRFEPE